MKYGKKKKCADISLSSSPSVASSSLDSSVSPVAKKRKAKAKTRTEENATGVVSNLLQSL